MLMVTTPVRLGKCPLASKAKAEKVMVLTWSTGFIATPRVLGHELRLTANLCLARDASVQFGQPPSDAILPMLART